MAAKFYRYAKVFRTELLRGDIGTFVVDPVRIEIFRGPRDYTVTIPTGPWVKTTAAPQNVLATSRQSTLLPGFAYIEVVARTKKPVEEEAYCHGEIDRAITQLAALYSPDLFVDEVLRGWLTHQDTEFIKLHLKRADPLRIQPEPAAEDLRSFARGLTDAGLNDRFTLQSRLFTRAIALPPAFAEERFLWLWIVLEVFPMEDESNIAPISDYLATITGRPAAAIKEKLQIGRLFGARSKLVHNGRLPYGEYDLGDVITHLEAIVVTVLRSEGGLSYDGRLDRYL